jgi:hypothetical protein
MRVVKLFLAGVIVVAWSLTGAGAAQAGRLVYMGPDPSCHYGSNPEAVTLAMNAIQWAGNGSNPRILLVVASCDGDGLLATAGFTQVTSINESQFSSTSLSNFDVIYVTYSSDSSSFISSANKVATFVNSGGGLVIEGNANSIAWAPFGSQVGYAQISTDVTAIVDGSHPVMANLTNAGLSGWGSSSHSEFFTPAAAGFTTLAVDGNDEPNIIVFSGLVSVTTATQAPVMGWPALTGLTLLLLVLGLHRVRRTRAVST